LGSHVAHSSMVKFQQPQREGMHDYLSTSTIG
jgi:hypothetical protein